ncbi:MAG: DNA methylase [Oscillospiraceae bacterium]|nr:DNA methylase [Oscillospiraceae bacterium]
MEQQRTYIAIDLKSFYASVECVERGLDPLTTNLVVADKGRTEKTICLAVSPSLKAYGIPGRARLFEVVEKVKEVNALRFSKNGNKPFKGKSTNSIELKDPSLKLDFIAATPRMKLYMEYSTRIYQIYLKYVAPEDIHVYSVDEVFIDVTNYLKFNKMTPREMALAMVKDVFNQTKITATAGIGTNLYLAKVAMDIEAKHIKADKDGVRIAELDEMSYRRNLWDHRPLTDFWRVGRGYAKKLEANGLYTMGDIARCSVGQKGSFYSEDLLYKLFGINAELLIDHAWGWEPCTIAEIKAYKPENNSVSQGQVLKEPYSYEKARIVVREMVEMVALDLVDKGLVTDQIVLTIGYDIIDAASYKGEIITDYYGRKIPKQAHGSASCERFTASTKLLTSAAMEVFDNIVDKNLHVRRIYVVANHVMDEKAAKENMGFEQLDLFKDYEAERKTDEFLEKESSLQHAMLGIKKKYGKNAILKGTNFKEGATAIERNGQVGGHKA